MPGFNLADKPMRHPRLEIAILLTLCLFGTIGLPALARPPHKKALADYLGPRPGREAQ